MKSFVLPAKNPHFHLTGEQWNGRELYDYRFYELEIVDCDLPLAVFSWDGYMRNDVYHRHCDFYELVLVYQGVARNDNGHGREELISAGSVFLFPPGSVHRYIAINELAHYNILFRPELFSQLRYDLDDLPGYQMLFKNFGSSGNPAAVSPLLSLSEKEMAPIILLLEECRQELAGQQPGFRAAAVAAFLRAIAVICRSVKPQTGRCGENSFRISRVVEMLNRRYPEKLQPAVMARFAGMSESNFRHQFSDVMGIAPGEYLTRLRLKMAAPLLTTPENITAIACRVGFEDGNFFSRQFRKYAGLTPSQFRRQLEDGTLTLQELASRLLLPGPEYSSREIS